MLQRLHTLAFEADEGALSEGAGAGEAIDTGDVDAGAAAEVGQSFDYESPDFQQAVGYAVQDAMSQLLQQAAQHEGGEEGEAPELDPYNDPDGFQGYLQQAIDQGVQRHLQQITPTVQAFEDQQNQQLVEEWCESEPAIQEAQAMLTDADGNQVADASNLVQFAASGYLPDLEERYGPGERATRQAIRMAADQIKTTLKAAHDAGYQARNAELQGLSGARPPVTPGSGPVEAVHLEDEPADELAAIARISARNGWQ